MSASPITREVNQRGELKFIATCLRSSSRRARKSASRLDRASAAFWRASCSRFTSSEDVSRFFGLNDDASWTGCSLGAAAFGAAALGACNQSRV